ncbi:DUF2946 family protein [Neorhizobium sp. NPDC001467]|uniref:DUF2946 family protein n=1 Tax=Neorhizobium sp. NPDC001467 TaxID=3390595 RepID=UPI003D00AACA
MRFVRKIIADSLSGGVIALLVSLMMMLDGAIGAHALGAMVAAERAAASEIICSGAAMSPDHHHGHASSMDAGKTGHEHDGSAGRPDCCSAACQFVAQFAATDLPVQPVPQWPVPSRASPIARDYAPFTLRPHLHSQTARGPPAFQS